jgi:hypothetical protein
VFRSIRSLALLALAPLVAPAAAAQSSPPADSASLIREIRYERSNIFAAAEAKGFLPKLVNGVHITTQPRVVQREVLFQVGDRYDSAAVAETARNLRRLGVFQKVTVDSVRADSGLAMVVRTQDGWSTKPSFSFRSTGQQVAWRASLIEENLLGTASRLALSYRKDPDRSTILFGFRQPRLIASQVGVFLQYEDRSDGSIVGGQLALPFLSLESHRSWSVGAETRDETILRFFEGETVPSDTVVRLLDFAGASYGWALKADGRDYLRFGVSGRVWQDDFVPTLEDQPADRHTFGGIGASLEYRHARFIVTRFRAGRDEDIDLSTTVRAGLALTPDAFGYDDNGVVPSLSARVGGTIGRTAFGYIDLNAHGRLTPAGLDSGAVQTAATLVWQPIPRHIGVFHAWAGWLDQPRPGGEFDLGLGLGPRGFQLHAFTGDRGVFTTAEYRYMVARDFLKLMDLGLAAFADYGGAWYHDDKKRTGWNYGLGIRVGPSRATGLDQTRIDLVRRVANDVEPAGWLVVIARGLVFTTGGIMNR